VLTALRRVNNKGYCLLKDCLIIKVVTVLFFATLLFVIDLVDKQVLCFRLIVEKIRLRKYSVLILGKY
jgi:hypothetical protein